MCNSCIKKNPLLRKFKKDIKQVLVVHEHNFHFGPFDQPRNDGQSTLIAWNTITTFLESKLYVFD